MKKIFLLLILGLVGSKCFSQQLPHFSQYMLNGFLINPAVAGSENYCDVKLGYRNYWMGITGAPTSFYTTLHTPINKLNLNTTATSFPLREKNGSKQLYREYKKGNLGKVLPHHGVGFSMIADAAGALKRSGFSLTYAYHLPLNRKIKMSAGISMGLTFYDVDQAKLSLTHPDDPTFLSYRHINPTIRTGIRVYSQRFFLGFTAAQLFQDEMSRGGWNNKGRTHNQYYLAGGYKIALSPKFSILPSTLIKYLRPVAVSADANMKFLYADKVWLGGSYRYQDAFVVMGGINFDNFIQISYAYDMPNSRIGRMSSGSHEVVLGILLNNKGRIFSPSDFW